MAELSTATGISVSTLSRLESGQRRPALELLLPLTRAHAVPIDELVGAPPTGDPRVHLRPVTRYGMTMVPLTRRAGGAQAYKLVSGEAAEFDTRVPHWFGSADTQPVELRCLFGRQGERAHPRAKTQE